MKALQPTGQSSVERILAAFADFDRKYKRAEVDAAIANRDEIVPLLIEVLEGVLADPEKAAEDERYFAQVYALMLLGHFRESRAHRVIVALSGLREDLPYRLFGDTITEDLSVILLRTCNGSFEAIKGLIQDRAADDYCRGAAAQAITYGVVEGMVQRGEALSYFGGLFKDCVASVNGAFYSMIASCICDLYPEEQMETIEAAYAKGLIYPGFISIDSFNRALSRGKERCLLDLRAELERRSLDDVHGSMSWWACFHERSLPQVYSGSDNRMAARNKAKRKRRIAKGSRKSNRRKKK